MISTFSCPKSLRTEGERRRALWRVAIVLEALGPAPRLLEVTGAELLARWTLDPVNWQVSSAAGPPWRSPS